MKDSAYQGTVLIDILHKNGYKTIDKLQKYGEKNIYLINQTHVILIKYSSKKTKAYFKFTDNEAVYLSDLESNFPQNTYVVFTNGDTIKCSLNIKQLSTICNINLDKKRKVDINKINDLGLIVKGSLRELPDQYPLNEYLSFLS